MALTGARLMRQFPRPFTTGCAQSCVGSQGRIMNKLLSNGLERNLQGTNSAARAVKMLDKKRHMVLSKLYLKNVSRALAFGGFDQVYEKGIIVTRVSLRSASNVTIYWTAKENEDPVEIQNLLDSIAGSVAYDVMNFSMMGRLPNFIFKRDNLASQVATTEKLLAKVSLENEMYETMFNDEKIEISDVKDVVEPADSVESGLTLMRMDTLGLPHDAILRRILLGRSKAHLYYPTPPPTTEEMRESQSLSSSFISEDLDNNKICKKKLAQFIARNKKSNLNS